MVALGVVFLTRKVCEVIGKINIVLSCVAALENKTVRTERFENIALLLGEIAEAGPIVFLLCVGENRLDSALYVFTRGQAIAPDRAVAAEIGFYQGIVIKRDLDIVLARPQVGANEVVLQPYRLRV